MQDTAKDAFGGSVVTCNTFDKNGNETSLESCLAKRTANGSSIYVGTIKEKVDEYITVDNKCN